MSQIIFNEHTKDRLIAALLERAEFTLTAEPEDISPEGHFGYDTEEECRAAEREVYELAKRTEWGWCCAHVRASFMGFHGDDYLGACSYESEEDFRTPGGYYDDMKLQACTELADQLIAASRAVQALIGE